MAAGHDGDRRPEVPDAAVLYEHAFQARGRRLEMESDALPNGSAAQVASVNDFNYAILAETSHRPWPLPTTPWVMTQTWHELLFAHWPVNEQELSGLVPPGLPLDLYEGRA